MVLRQRSVRVGLAIILAMIGTGWILQTSLDDPRAATVRIVPASITLTPATATPSLSRVASHALSFQDDEDPFEDEQAKPQTILRDPNDRSPRLGGYERWPRGPEQAVARGLTLLTELNCVACHRDPDGLIAANGPFKPRVGPDLSLAGDRLQAWWLVDYLKDPRGTVHGTTMPDLLRDRPEAERAEIAEALAHFLATNGGVLVQPVDRDAVIRGSKLYHTIGCVACHGPRDGSPVDDAALHPLGTLSTKYHVSGLAAFLTNPRVARPSGRMPHFGLDLNQARDLANFLLSNQHLSYNVTFIRSNGDFNVIPDFDEVIPVETGNSVGFEVARGQDQFAMRFEGFLTLEQAGTYVFFLFADDLGRLTIDDQVIIESTYPNESKVKVPLEAGVHRVVVEYVEFFGEENLRVEILGPGLPRQRLDDLLTITPQAAPPVSSPPRADAEALERPVFKPNAELAQRGRRLFGELGCASCHTHNGLGENESDTLARMTAPKLNALRIDRGCLSATGEAGAIPAQYDLSEGQRLDLIAALSDLQAVSNLAKNAGARIHQTLVSFNCVACHQRDDLGGPLASTWDWFKTTTPEMGDEGRLPPNLTGVGDKLRRDWLRNVLHNGAKERPYMLVKMPGFGPDALGDLDGLLEAHDLKPPLDPVAPLLDPLRMKAAGRVIVGDKGVSCIACHVFGDRSTAGIKAIDLTRMHARLREDWVTRYLYDPQAYRPGTRMPASWPDGRSLLPDLLEGSTAQQILALQLYLADGSQAAPPSGLGGNPIELVPKDAPILYRNFLQGVGLRGIAVGFPEQAHFFYDLEAARLAVIYRGAFLDASLHWEGRGQGNQRPLGDVTVNLPFGTPLARLAKPEDPWPTHSPRDQGYRFLGYRLDDRGQPIFRYRWNNLIVEDFIRPFIPTDESEPIFLRTLTLSASSEVRESQPPGSIWLRLAQGPEIRATDHPGEFQVGPILRIRSRIASSSAPEQAPRRVETTQGPALLAPVRQPDPDQPTIVEWEYRW